MIFFSEYSKVVIFSIVPVLALNAKLLFKRLKLNLAEHLIMGGITLLGILLLSTFYISFDILNETIHSYDIVAFLKLISLFSIPLYPIWAYYNFTKGFYKFLGFSWRMLLFYLLTLAELIAITLIVSIFFLNATGALKVNL